MRFKGDIIITDPCYIIRDEDNGMVPLTHNDWHSCHCGRNMEVLGIKNYISRSTEYGDWSCTTYNTDTEEIIGEFCADAGMVSVFLLDEVLSYNPNFDYHKKRKWTTTWIKDFDGEVEFKVIYEDWLDEESGKVLSDKVVHVVGNGNINFDTRQTGF